MLCTNPLPPAPFSQRDARWADINIGTSKTTIGRAGCTITSAASCLVALGVDTDPGRLNRYLVTHSGFVDGNLMRFDAFGPLGISCVGVIECEDVAAPVERIYAALGSGQAVIAKVDFRPGGSVDQHWVRILSLDDLDAEIMDPWNPPPKMVYYLMSRYAAPVWSSPARCIFRIVIYAAGDVPARLSFTPDLEPQVVSVSMATQVRLTKRRLHILRNLL